jgi:hypothetical protein
MMNKLKEHIRYVFFFSYVLARSVWETLILPKIQNTKR